MTRFEFIEALKQALTGLPPDLIARTVAEYERRIFEASAAGQSEDEIMAGLGEPQQIADDLRAGLAPKVPAVLPSPVATTAPVSAPKGPINAVRMFFSFIGLMLFNLFLVTPVTVYAALLFAAYVTSLAFFGGGIVLTAGGVSGVNQIVLNEPFHHIRIVRPHGEIEVRPSVHSSVTTGDGEHTTVNIGESGIHVETDADAHPTASAPAPTSAAKETTGAKVASGSAVATPAASATASAPAPADNAKAVHEHTVVDIGPQGVTVLSKGKGADEEDWEVDGEHGKRFLRHGDDGDDHNVNIDMPGLHIHDGDVDTDESVISLGGDFISASRPAQIGVGLGITLAGIIGFLLCLVVSRYTLLGLYRLAQMELAVLRGA